MVALRSLHFFPQTISCKAIGCLPTVLDMPLLERIPVLDDAGIEYAVDVAPTQGLFFLVAIYALYRNVVLLALATQQRKK